MHDDGGGGGRINRPSRTKLLDFDDEIARGDRFGRKPRSFLAKEQNAGLWQRGFVDRDRAGDVVDTDDTQVMRSRPIEKLVNRGVVNHVLVSVGHHRPALVPAPAPHYVYGVREKGVRGSNNRPNVEVMLPILDRHVESVTFGIEISDNRFHCPIAVFVDDVAGVAVFEERWVEVWVVRPLALPRTNAMSGKFGCRRIALLFRHSVNLGE